MEDRGVLREGEFVWQIPNFQEKKKYKSSVFRFGKYNCFLDVNVNDNDVEEMCCKIFLNASNEKTVNYNTFLNLSLNNEFGEEFVSTKRIALKFDDYFQLMKIWYSDLRRVDNYLLPHDVLTLRMSWCDEENNTCEQDNSEEESSKMLQTLSNDFVRFYETKKDANSSLRVGTAEIPVHSAVLSARSEFFAYKFRKNRSGVVDISDVNAGVLGDVLYYIYSGKIRGMSADTIVLMYEVADSYALSELKHACLNVLMRSLTVENVCDAARLVHIEGETELEKEVVQFLKEKWKEIKQTQKWKELLKSEPALAQKLRTLLPIYKDGNLAGKLIHST